MVNDTNITLPERLRKTDDFLRSLNKMDFMTFIREAGKDPMNELSEAAVGMVIFAKSYKAGPGKDEPLMDTLRQLRDPTLPATWKTGLLDVLRLSQRPDVLEQDFEPVLSSLLQCGEDKRNSDAFRSFCLGKLGNVLHAQKSLLIDRCPDLKEAILHHNKVAINRIQSAQPANSHARKALSLLGEIDKFTTALRAAMNDVKNTQVRNHLEKHIKEWTP
jgi:hypothetical protein